MTTVELQRGRAEPTTDWHTIRADAAFERLGSSRDGLTRDDARERLAKHGPNELEAAERVRPLTILIAQFQSLLVGLLVVAGIAAWLLGDWLDGVAIFAIVLLNAAIGFFQEYRAGRAIEALREMAAPHAKVRRGGKVLEIAARDVVPGDVVELAAGDLVPADLRLLESSSLRCAEAALTGESEPVGKEADLTLEPETALADRRNLAFSGTDVVRGSGLGLVVATGMQTEFGRIAAMLGETGGPEDTPLQQRLNKFGRVLVYAASGIVGVLFLLGLLRGVPVAEMFLTAVSLAVAAVPEGLPAIVTIALALGVTRMARRRALIRRLPAVETLGSADVICTDKTGTLTVGAMTVRALYAGGASFEVTGEGYGPDGDVEGGDEARALLQLFAGCCDAHLVQEDGEWRVVGDPTEGALLAAARKAGILQPELEGEQPRRKVWPFDAERKRMSVAREVGSGELRLLVKGAPEVVLARCTRIRDGDQLRELTDADRTRIEQAQQELAGRALRVLTAAWREVDEAELSEEDPDQLEQELVFGGLAGMYDPPRPGAQQAIERCESAGIRVVMLTGDHPQTARAVARELGLAADDESVVAGPEFEQMSDEELARRVQRIRVYARVTAAHKLRIVRAWKEHGSVVAMTGDGVNDAPAIQGADIGVAMGRTGTEVTKQASSMIVTDDDFASIVAAVEEGRGTYDNIRKTLQYLLAGNTGELLLMTSCIVGGLPLPLLPIHLLWINLVTDGLPALALATDPIDPDVMRRAPRPRDERLAGAGFFGPMLLTGVTTASVAFGVYLWALGTVSAAQAQSYVFGALVFEELLRSFSARSETKPIWRLGLLGNVKLAAIVAATLGFQIAAHQVEPLRAFFETQPLTWTEFAVLFAVALIPLAVLEVRKVLRRS